MSNNVQSIERALTILDMLSEYPDGIQITRLSEIVGLNKSTTHRLLATLVNMNYVVKDDTTDKYKLGLQIVYLSRNILSNMNITEISKPYLEKLVRDVNETVHLCIEDNGEVMYVDKIESNQTIRMYSRIGSRAPMYCTGVGKVLLSGMSETKFNKIVSKMEFFPRTEATITSKEELIREVEKIKQQQYSLDNVEYQDGIRCIAAPIFDYNGNIIATFSISGPSNRVTMDVVNNLLIDKVRQTTAEISLNFGYVEKKTNTIF